MTVAAPARVFNPWLIALAVVIPAFMEVLDTTIANVSLRHIAGGLSAAETDSEWVITSYLAANALILPISGWISARLGRRNYFLLSIAVFTLASVLCGMAASLPALIFFRALQGLAGGGLQPSSQAILLDTFPVEKQGAAQTLFGVAALIAPVVGPTLGGWITDQASWRWIFYINFPVGTVAFAAAWILVRDPAYLREEREALRKQPFQFDTIGLGLLALGVAAWEVLLSKGQEWDWLGDPFGRVQIVLILFVLCVGGLIVWERRQARPIVNFRPLRDRNFLISCPIIFAAFAILYGSSTLLPTLLESLFGYDALRAGLILSPSGFFSITAVIIGGTLIGKGLDARALIGPGLVIAGIGSFWMSRMNLDISPSQAVWPRIVLVIGIAFIFAPINVAAFLYIPREMRGAAVGLFALLRNEGGSFGISIGQTIVERREQFHALRLNEYLDPLNPATTSFLDQTRANLVQQLGDPVAAKQIALQALDNIRTQQALSLSYFDAFLLFAILGFSLSFLVPLMKRSVVAKGVHVSAE